MEYVPFCDPTDMFPGPYCSSCPYLIMPIDDVFRYDENEWECGYTGTEYRDPYECEDEED
ncbi:MAG: hypothetical protein J1F23_08810 [Oscillospiraceae bacterium]|nr:hypothetical protein [Oscillospiraceae bacterium]